MCIHGTNFHGNLMNLWKLPWFNACKATQRWSMKVTCRPFGAYARQCAPPPVVSAIGSVSSPWGWNTWPAPQGRGWFVWLPEHSAFRGTAPWHRASRVGIVAEGQCGGDGRCPCDMASFGGALGRPLSDSYKVRGCSFGLGCGPRGIRLGRFGFGRGSSVF